MSMNVYDDFLKSSLSATGISPDEKVDLLGKYNFDDCVMDEFTKLEIQSYLHNEHQSIGGF